METFHDGWTSYSRSRQTEPDKQSQTNRARQSDPEKKTQTNRPRQTDPEKPTQTNRLRQINPDKQTQTNRRVVHKDNEIDERRLKETKDKRYQGETLPRDKAGKY